MHGEPCPEVQLALQLVRRGRFFDALTLLKQFTKRGTTRHKDPLASAILADVLQRIGHNEEAESIAKSNLRRPEERSELNARFHFVLGNVLRERGDIAAATKYLQMAATMVDNTHEFSCWAHLRLLAAVAELNGRQAAIARLDEVKHVLTKFGDARPFAALHLWHVETETMVGALDNARRHLNIAASLLAKVDDVWLHGYLAINSSVLNYYSADVSEARRWAEAAIVYAGQSGHRTTRRAAYTNLGYFELARGELAKAQDYFETALQSCERGSVSEIAILDNIAETKLERGDFDGCRSILAQLESLAAQSTDAKRRQYNAWALQTGIRLCVREGRRIEARELSRQVQPILDELPHSRLSTECRLLSAEALLSTEPLAAAKSLAPMFSDGPQLAPDLFAELERLSGKTLEASGSYQLARVHFDRAASVFEAIGHSLGKNRTVRELTSLPAGRGTTDGVETTLDRLRTLLDMRNRAELFGREAIELLHELNCAASVELQIADPTELHLPATTYSNRAPAMDSPRNISIALGSSSGRNVILSFVPLGDPKSQLTALSFKRVIGEILASTRTDTTFGDHDIVWPSNSTLAIEGDVIFASEAMLAVLRTVRQIAPTDISALITGETGTGKEVIAKIIHQQSRRAAMPFIALNCAAVPKDLLESQLFGHRRGAFSGAVDTYPGIVRAANGGTLFLDEIGEIPLEMQTKLLRFLEMNEVHPIGEPHPVKVDVRLVFATNGDLEEAVSRNAFRRDLFYRLNVIPIKLPALRDRREEIPILANFFAQRFASELAKEPLRFSTEAMQHLILYAWPGNIRQLANEIRRLTAVLHSGDCIMPDHLSTPLMGDAQKYSQSLQSDLQLIVRVDQSIQRASALLESEMIKYALRSAGGHLTEAATALGISRKGLYLKRLRLGLLNFDGRTKLRSKY